MLYAPPMPNRLAKSTELVCSQQKFHLKESVTYVEGGVVAAGAEGTAADAIGIVIVLVPA